MDDETVVDLYRHLTANGVTIWVDGGWGIDALLGRQTRAHSDLDIAVSRRELGLFRQLTAGKGYAETPERGRPENFVLANESGQRVDVHVFELDPDGNNVYGIAYPRESLTGEGVIASTSVRCISLQWVLNFHANYEPDPEDVEDIRALCERFGVSPPANYRQYFA